MSARTPSGARRALAFSLCLLLPCLAPAGAFARQTNSGTLFGRVRDRSGRGVGGARVQVVNEETGNPRARVTSDDGYFTIENLRAGTYTINASKEGYFPQSYPRFQVQITVKNEVKVPEITLRQAAVEGRVTDRAGNALGGAKVIMAGLAARVRASAATDARGLYRIEDLPPGAYIVTAAWGGAEGHGLTSEPLTLEREETSAPTLKLLEVLRGAARQSGAGQPAGQVTEGARAASLVHTVDAARVSNFGGRLFESVPVGGSTPMRSFDEFALLAPGVSPPPYTPGARGPGVGYGVGTAGQFSVNGMRARSNNFSVDGSDNNDPDVGVRRQGFVALVPQPIESVKDFSVATLLWDAELGRNFGGQVNAVSAYGGNEFHGTLYGLLTDSSLNARNYFDTGVGGEDPFTRSQVGFTFGGPVRRDRTHFFFSYERQQASASSEQHFATPSAAERRFSQVVNYGSPAGLFGAGIFASTTIYGPFQHTTPLGRSVLSLYPLPNNPSGPYGANNYTQVLPADGRGDVFSAKLSQQVWSGGLFGGRYNFTDDRRTLPAVNRAVRSTIDSATRSHNLSLVLDSPLNSRFFSQARFSFGRTALDFFEHPLGPYIFQATSTEFVQGSGLVTARTGPLGELLIVPYSPVGVGVETFPQRRTSSTFQFADTVSFQRGGHSFKFGGNVRRYHLDSRLDRFYRPQAVYGGAVVYRNEPALIPGVQLASIGVASSLLQTLTLGPPDSRVRLRFTEYHAFFNDNWRVRPRLAFDFGLRYEYNTVPRDASGRLENALSLNQLPQAGLSLFDTAERTAAFNSAVGAYRQVLGGRTSLYDPDRNNFGPRAGFAWALDSQGTTVLRGGYGVYFDTTLGAVISQSRNVFPNEIPLNVDPSFLQFSVFNLNNPVYLAIGNDPSGNPFMLVRPGPCNQFGTCNQLGGGREDMIALVGQLFTRTRDAFNVLRNPSGGLAFTLPERRLRTPYAQQWHLTLEREFLNDYYVSAAYVGTKGTKLTRLVTPNLGALVTPTIPIVAARGAAAASFPYPIIATSQVANGFVSVLPDPPGACPPVLPGADPTLPFVCGDAGFTFDSRPNGALGAYRIFENSAASNYHALQLEARKRYSRGFQFTAAYTWSHAIDDVSDLFPLAGAPVLAQDSLDLRAERASANFDVRQRFASSLVWDLPDAGGPGGARAVFLGGWQLASSFQYHTGQPFTLNLPFDYNLDGNLSDRPPSTDGLIFFGGHGARRVALAPGRQATDYISTLAVNGRPRMLVFRNGAVGRNTARGDSFVNLDLAFAKRFAVTEGQYLLFRTELFNALNRANFGLPVRVVGAPGFGTAVDTASPARMIQFVVKYQF
jgi:hypothetical protein